MTEICNILQSCEKLLKFGQEQPDSPLKLPQILVRSHIRRPAHDICLKVPPVEQGRFTLLAKPYVNIDSTPIRRLFSSRFGHFIELAKVTTAQRGQHTRCYTKRNFTGTASRRVTAHNPPAGSAMVSAKGIAGEILLAERTPKYASVVLPANNSLLERFPLVVLP
jgi:hypothetical protein